MKTTGNAILLAVCAIAILAFASPADAAETPEKTFRVVTTFKDGSPIVEVGIGVDVGAIVRSFSSMYRDSTKTKEKPEGEALTWQIIHSANPNAVIPVCRVPQDGNMWRGRGDTSVWDNCPASDRYIGLIAGHSGHIRVPIALLETYEQKEVRVSKLVSCFDSVPCLNERIKTLGGQPVAAPVAPVVPPKPAAPVAESKPSTSSNDDTLKNLKSKLESAQTERDQLLSKNGWLSKDNASLQRRPAWLAVLPLILLAFVVGMVLGRFKRRPNARARESEDLAQTLVYEKPKSRQLPVPSFRKQSSPVAVRIADLDKTVVLETANSNLSLAIEQADELNKKLSGQITQLSNEKEELRGQLEDALRRLQERQAPVVSGKIANSGNGERKKFIPKPSQPQAGAKPVDIQQARLEAVKRKHIAEMERLYGEHAAEKRLAAEREQNLNKALEAAKKLADDNLDLCLSSESKRDALKAEIELLKKRPEEPYSITDASAQAIDVTMRDLARSLSRRAKPFVLMGFVYRWLNDAMDTLTVPDEELVCTLDIPTRMSLLQQMPLLDCVVKLRAAGIKPPQLATLPSPVLSATG